MKVRNIVLAGGLICAFAVAGFFVSAWRPSIPGVEPPRPDSFDPTLVRRGAELAAIGDCGACHTAAGGKSFAGGFALPTPFGTIYSTNITPDPDTGIGRWSLAAFQRAMREGVDRDGRHLYPAFPYDHFTLVTDQDNAAIYAYLMSRDPVRAENRRTELRFPYNMRIALAGWKLLFLRSGPYQPDSAHDQSWNRGAYLVEGLGHCGACHTPHNMLGAEQSGQRLAGGSIDGWTAYALNASSPAPVPWDKDALYDYLRRGWHADHGVAGGPMAPVVADLAAASDTDISAIADYIAAGLPVPSADRLQQAQALRAGADKPAGRAITADSQRVGAGPSAGDAGAQIYAAACAGCHEGNRPLPFGAGNLALSSAIQGPDAKNLINITLSGLPAVEGKQSAIMPGFAAALSDEQIVELASYLRSRFSKAPEWTRIADEVRAARAGLQAASAQKSGKSAQLQQENER